MALVLTNVYLDKGQRDFLEKKAKAGKRAGSNLSIEVRKAVDLYRAGITAEELQMLDEATRRAAVDLREMAKILGRGNRRATEFFAEIERIKNKVAA